MRWSSGVQKILGSRRALPLVKRDLQLSNAKRDYASKSISSRSINRRTHPSYYAKPVARLRRECWEWYLCPHAIKLRPFEVFL
jgi:hypothetical protein